MTGRQPGGADPTTEPYQIGEWPASASPDEVRDGLAAANDDQEPVLVRDEGPHGPRWWTPTRVYAAHVEQRRLWSIPRNPPADAPTTETWTEYRVPQLSKSLTTQHRDRAEQAAQTVQRLTNRGDFRVESREVTVTRTETAWTEMQP